MKNALRQEVTLLHYVRQRVSGGKLKTSSSSSSSLLHYFQDII
jgi:hypothetical protein